MTTRVSSRLARKQQQKVLLQIVGFGVAAVALGLAFLFYILPNSVKLLNFLTGNNGTVVTTSDQSAVPPQVPQLSAPPQATNSAQISLTGFAQQNVTVILLKNGTQADQTTAGSDGTFTFNVPLDEGDNKLAAFARNTTTSKESDPSQTFDVVKDTQPPSLTMSQPTDGQSFQLQKNQVISIGGTTDPGAQVTVNGRVAYVNDQGGFTLTYQLQNGANQLEIVATDQAGNQTTKDMTVNFSP